MKIPDTPEELFRQGSQKISDLNKWFPFIFLIFIILFFARILWGVSFSFIRQAGIMTVTAAASDSRLGKSMGFSEVSA